MIESETQPKNQAIRANREKMRLNIKHMNMKFQNSLSPKFLKPEPETGVSVGIRRRRKTSQNIKDFDYMSIFKDKTINETFESLYTLGEKLGEGSQAVVYKCVQKQTGKQKGVKVSKKRDLELLENMRINYQIMKELNHESIIKGEYLFLNEQKLTCHMVMELYPYPELREFIKRTKGMASQQKVANIVYLLLVCCDYLQEKCVCHRDLKPENILYDEEKNQIRLIDFEIARMQRYSHEKLELMTNCGTLHYRAPETFSKTYGIPVDIWAVGIIMFELLTGYVPFKTKEYGKTVRQICKKEIDYKQYDLSPCAVNLLKRILQKNPQHRIHPKEALSSPFILKNLSKKNLLQHQQHHFIKHHHSFKEVEQHFSDTSDDEEQQKADYIIRVYNEDTKFNFQDTLDKDIGVRRCEVADMQSSNITI